MGESFHKPMVVLAIQPWLDVAIERSFSHGGDSWEGGSLLGILGKIRLLPGGLVISEGDLAKPQEMFLLLLIHSSTLAPNPCPVLFLLEH